MLDEDVVTCQNRAAQEKKCKRITKSRRGERAALAANVNDELFCVICRECALGARTSEPTFRHSSPLFASGPECSAADRLEPIH